MAWQMPAPGQWPAAMAMSQNMNMGSYTPEQWAALQQQNWQQWNQWQQQYTQWQQQYGEKYAQQIQATQAMPPLPSGNAPPPAPPPPEQPPPPPPPHENNQPLYGNINSQPQKTPANRNTNSNYSNVKTVADNNQWSSYNTDMKNQQESTVNIEALNKLEEEEKAFDIQFKKWEEEIEKWRKENVDHPDKQAYKEYEQKFEACRKQLLERRQQMKLNRARLMNNVSQVDNTTAPAAGSNMSSTVPPQNASHNKSNPNTQGQNYKNNMNTFKPQYNQQSGNRNNNKNIDPQDRYESYQDMDNSHNSANVNIPISASMPIEKSDPSTFLPTSSSGKPIPGLDLVPDNINKNNKQDVVDITDDHNNVEKNMQNNMQHAPDYSKISKGINNILGDEKIMNILSMVQGQNVSQPQVQVPPYSAINFNNAPPFYPGNNQNFPYMNQDNRNTNNNFNQDQQYNNSPNMPYNRHGPNIPVQPNQGINAPQQQEMYNEGSNMPQGDYFNRNTPYGGPNNRGPDMRQSGHPMRQGDFDNRVGDNMRPGGDMRPSGPGMRQGGGNMRQGGLDIRQGGPDMRQGGPDMRQVGPDMRQGGPDMRQVGPDMRQGRPDMRQGGPDLRQGGPDMRQGGPDMRQGGPDMRQGGPDMRQGGPDMRQGGPDMRQGGPDMRQGGPDMRQGGPDLRQGGPDMRQGGPPNMHMGGPYAHQNNANMGPQVMKGPGGNQTMQPPYNNMSIPPLMSVNNRPPLQDMSAKHNVNDYYGPERPMCDNVPIINPPRPKWVEEPLFAPSLVVEYDHKPLRLKARDFIEPVHTFDYNHKSKDEDLNKKKDFEKEVDQLFVRKSRRPDEDTRYVRDTYHRDYERRMPREDIRDRENYGDREIRDDYRDRDRDEFRERLRERPREDTDRWRTEDRFDERRRDESRDYSRRDERRDDRRDDRDRVRRDDYRDRDRDRRDDYRDRERIREDSYKDMRRDDTRHNSRSKDDSRKRALSKESEVSSTSKKSKGTTDATTSGKKHVVMIDDILEPPGRDIRPEKIVIILRGIPGSGKSYLAKLIRDREAEHGGTVRIMSIDDYFMQEGETEEKDPQTGKIIRKPYLKYEYDEAFEDSYMNSLKRAFKRTLTDGYFTFLIYDAVNEQLKSYADIWNFARQNGFQVYICTMVADLQTCYKRNIHNRSLEEIQIINTRFFETPSHHIQLDPTTLLQSASITEVQMEDAEDDVIMEDVQDEVESVFTSKWEKMDDAVQLARLDGTSKPLRPSQYSMEDYLQLDEWKPNTAKPGKKTVRWADIEERREQEKMRAIGFVVGQTDWNRMTDPTMGSSALTQTKYIERVRRF